MFAACPGGAIGFRAGLRPEPDGALGGARVLKEDVNDSVAAEDLATRIGVLAVVGILITVVVYGAVALIVKLDDIEVVARFGAGGKGK